MADKSIGSLFVEYRATADKFLADLKKMSKDAKEFDNTIKPLRERALDIGKSMSLVGGAVTTAFFAMTKQAANYGDQIRDASIRTGVTTEALSGLKYAAEQTGTSFDGVSLGLTRLTRTALAASAGSKEGSRAFAALGVSVKDASGQLRPMDQILGDVADRFSKMKDGTEKAAAAQLLFGRNGAQMIEFLNQGRAGLQAFQEQAERLGIVIGPEFSAAADQFNDEINNLKNAQLGLSITIGTILLPVMTKLVNLAIVAAVEFRKFADVHPELTRAMFALSVAIAGAGGLLLGLAGVLTILPKLRAAFLLLYGALTPLTLGIFAVVAAFTASLVIFPRWRAAWVNFAKNLVGELALIGSQLGSFALAINQLKEGKVGQAFETLRNAGRKSLDDMVGAMDRFDSATETAGNIIQEFKNTFDALNSSLKSAQPALQGVGEGFELGAMGATNAKDAVEDLNKAFIAQIRPADELSKKLQVLLRRFDERDVIRAYQDEIIETAATQREFGGAIDETIARLEKQSLAMRRASDIIKANRESILDGIKLAPSPDFLNLAPIVPPMDLSADLESLDQVVKNIGNSTQETARKSAEMFDARKRDTEADISRAKKWEQAWSQAVGNIISKFADSAVDALFSLGGDKNKIKGLEKQITDIKQSAERQRLENVVESLKKTNGVRTKALVDAENQLKAFDKRMEALREMDSQKQLRELEKDLANQTNLFRRFANGIKSLFMELGKSIVKIMVTDAFTAIAKAFSDVVIKPLTQKLGQLFGIASKGKAAESVLGTGGQAASGAATTADSVASSGAGLGASLLSGGLAAAGGIIGGLLTKGNAQRTEENTRETRDWLEFQTTAWNPLFNQMVYYQKGIFEALNGRGFVSGAQVSGLSSVTPSGSVSPSNVTIEFSANPTFHIDGSNLSAIQIRDEVIPAITTVLETGVRGIRERWAQLLDIQSVGTPAPTF